MVVDTWQHRAVEYLQKLKTPRAKAYYRCKKPCRTRKVLSKELWLYENPPSCTVCGKTDWRLDISRSDEQKNKTGAYALCYCDGAHYHHKPGSVKLCVQNNEYNFKQYVCEVTVLDDIDLPGELITENEPPW